MKTLMLMLILLFAGCDCVEWEAEEELVKQSQEELPYLLEELPITD